MYRRDYTDIVTGAALLVFGGFVFAYAAGSMELGTLRQMGPGYFPAALGLLLTGFGAAIMIPAFFRAGSGVSVEWRVGAAVLVGVGAFALLVRPAGLLPAICGLLLVVGMAERTFRPLPLLVMALALPAAAYLIFDRGLGLTIVMVRMPL